MKRILTFIVGGVMMVLGAACSSDDEPNDGTENGEVEAILESPSDLDGKLDDGLLSELLAGTRNGTLRKDTTVFYYLPKGWDHWYEETDVCYGRGYTIPYNIIFQDGEVYTPIKISNESGLYLELSLIWMAYQEVTGTNINFYGLGFVDKDFLIRRISIDDTQLYIHSFNGSDFVLSHTYNYWGGKYKEGGKILEVGHYEMSDATFDINGSNKIYKNHKECLQFILDKCRELFGEEVDVNKIFTDRILDIHIYNFDDIAKKYGLE